MVTTVRTLSGGASCETITDNGSTTATWTAACVVPTTPSTTQSTTTIPGAIQPSASDLAKSSSPILTSQTAGSTFLSNGGGNGTIPISHKKGLSDGAVAGVAIGMLLAGIIIAGAIFFFLLRRQKNRQHAYLAASHAPATYGSRPEKGPVVVASAVKNGVDDFLPQPVSDDTITDEVSKIRDNMKNHIRTYCHFGPANTPVDEAALRGIAAATGLNVSTLVGALSSTSARQDALRTVFAWVILSKATGGRNARLLPPELSGLSAVITGADGNNTQATLYSKWKTITGALLQPRFGKNAQDPGRASTFTDIIAELDSIVAPFVQGSIDGGQRRKNLDMILTRSANLAFLLFSQPGSFTFDFTSPRGGLAIFPALIQTVGDQGQILNPPRLLLEGEIVAV